MFRSRCDIHENNVDEIIPNLWLGDYHSSQSIGFLKRYNIKCIIRIMPEKTLLKFNTIKYVIVPIKDKDICNDNLNQLFDNLSEIIHHHLMRNEGVLIHCKRGHHRSATVTAAYLMKYYNYDYISVIKMINKIRPCSLNRGNCMMKSLYRYYQKLHNMTSCSNQQCIMDGRHSRCDLCKI